MNLWSKYTIFIVIGCKEIGKSFAFVAFFFNHFTFSGCLA